MRLVDEDAGNRRAFVAQRRDEPEQILMRLEGNGARLQADPRADDAAAGALVEGGDQLHRAHAALW